MSAVGGMPALSVRARRAVTWSAITTAARFTLQVGAQVSLARLLGPALAQRGLEAIA